MSPMTIVVLLRKWENSNKDAYKRFFNDGNSTTPETHDMGITHYFTL